MPITQQILTDMKQAMKGRDKTRLGALRMLRARLQEAEVAARKKQGLDYTLDDPAALVVLSRHVKQLRESIEAFRQGGAEERAEAEAAELRVVEAYLPEALGEDELRAIVREAIAESGAESMKQMGAVMALVMPRVKGAADGKAVQNLVREELAPQPRP